MNSHNCQGFMAPVVLLLILSASVHGAEMAVPAYFAPDDPRNFWTQLESAREINGLDGVGFAVMNPSNGPGKSCARNYVLEVSKAQEKGVHVIGYVSTKRGRRSRASVKKEIDNYFQWYGVNGIFFDEAHHKCSKLGYYQSMYNYVKARDVNATVVINPGRHAESCYGNVADIILNFENNYEAYVSWSPLDWEMEVPNKFWHLVYDTDYQFMPTAVALARQRNAAFIYVTPGKLPNPWDFLPPEPYWSDQLDLIHR